MTLKGFVKHFLPVAVAVSLVFAIPVSAATASNPEPQGILDASIKTGDVNNDGNIDAEDVLCALKIIAGIFNKQTLNIAAGDLNQDGKLSVRDALLLLQNLAGVAETPLKLGIKNASKTDYYIPEMYHEGSSFLSEDTIAFYGADGYGKYTTGGRGGRVIEVTTLEDSGPGSFREACEASGPRIVVFKVSGTINTINGITIRNGDITIAGETAPGDGICLASNALSVNADNVIIRYMTFRTGDQLNAWGLYNGGEFGNDALTLIGKNIIVDHCDATWGTDETLSVTKKDADDTITSEANTTDNITVQWCIVAESLVYSTNVGRRLGLGSLVNGAAGSKYSFHHNIYASHASRMPDIANGCSCGKCTLSFEFYNNVVYNWQGSAAGKCAKLDANGNVLHMVNSDFINNYYITGPESTGSYIYSEAVFGNTFHASGNMIDGTHKEDLKDLVVFESDAKNTSDNPYYQKDSEQYYSYDHADRFLRSERLDTSISSNIQTAEDASEDVLNYAGNSLSRDTLDTGLIESIRSKTGTCINYPFEAAGWTNGTPASSRGKGYGDWLIDNYPKLAAYSAYVDSDADGMSDAWEDFMGLNKKDASDGAASYLGTGYTNLDVFLQFLVENPMAAIAID